MYKRSRESKKDIMSQYYYVIYAFVGICVIAIGFSIFNPKQKFSEILVIDDAAMLVHNGQGHQFKQEGNRFFEHKTLADAKLLFNSALSDTNNNTPCKSSKGVDKNSPDEDIELPETYDWREAHKNCVQPIGNISPNQGNCSASYAFATLSAVEDRICM